MRMRLAGWMAMALILTALPGYAEHPALARARAAEYVIYGWVGQVQDIYTGTPQMVRTDKGFVLDRGKPAGVLAFVQLEGSMKGKMPRLIAVFRPSVEKESTTLFYRGAKVILFLKKMALAEVEQAKLKPGDYYQLVDDREGVLALNSEETKSLGGALDAAVRAEQISNTRKRAEAIAEKLPQATPAQATMLFDVLSQIDPEPAELALLDFVSAHPELYLPAAQALAKLSPSAKSKLARRYYNAKRNGLRALAVELMTPPAEVEGVADLLKTLASDGDEMVREAVARNLVRFDSAIAGSLREMLAADSSEKVRAALEASAPAKP